MAYRARELSPKALRFDNLAAAVPIDDPEVARSWELIREAIQSQLLGSGPSLDNLIMMLEAGLGEGANEYSCDIDETDPGRAIVMILDDVRSCSAPGLIAALAALRRLDEGAETRP